MKQTGLRLFAAIVLAVISTACERGPASVRTDKPAATTPRAQTPVVSTSRPAPLSDKLRQQALTASLSLAESCRQMQQQIGELLTSPSAQTLQAARQSWQSLHAASHLTSPALGLAASNPNLFAALATNIQRAHQYPIAPGFLDGVQGYPASGLVHDISVPIRRETLLQQHGLTDDSEATVGLHVLEFLLYGDTGERSAEDYRQAQNGSDQLKVAELPQNRRRNLLQLSARLTCESIEQLAAHWQPSSATVATLLRLPASSQLELWRNALGCQPCRRTRYTALRIRTGRLPVKHPGAASAYRFDKSSA